MILESIELIQGVIAKTGIVVTTLPATLEESMAEERTRKARISSIIIIINSL